MTIRVEEFNAYLAEVRRTYRSIPVMVEDFQSINLAWARGFLSVYWTEQFMRNLLTRVELLKGQVRAIRPKQPDLREIHGQYEEGLELYEKAFGLFLEQVPAPYPGSIDPVNVNLGQGNIRMARFQGFLSDLVGQQVALQ